MIKRVEQVDAGVKIQMFGEVKKQDIEKMVEECRSGQCSCSCDPSLMAKIEQIDVSGKDGKVEMSLKGKELSKESIEVAINECMG